MSFLKSLLAKPIDWVLPSRCPLCGAIVVENHQFCPNCWQELRFLNEPWCASCGVPFAFEHSPDARCAKCLEFPPYHDGLRAVVAYDSNSGKIPIGLKYSTKLGFAELIARHLEKYVTEFESDTLLVPVPLHRQRLWERGFNQSVLIADALSRLSGIPMRSDILIRKLSTPPLRTKTAKQRRKIVKNAIDLGSGAENHVAGKMVLLVDDVYTTGATANSCSKKLKLSGAEKVIVMCWARVVSDGETV